MQTALTSISEILPKDATPKWDDALWEHMPADYDERAKGVERIIEDARKDVSQTYEGRILAYEYHKKRFEMLWLGSGMYEQACRNLATALNI